VTSNKPEARSVGVDVAEARKGLDIVALDDNRRVVLSKGLASVADLLRLLEEFRPSIVCIDSPSGWALSGRNRAAERHLRTLGIHSFPTPTDPGDHSFFRWMRVGIAIYSAIAEAYPLCVSLPVDGGAIEVFPHASACLLAKRLRDPSESKQMFRRTVLEQYGIKTDALPTLDRIDAALAALTGSLALEGCGSALGDPIEGVIVVPVADLPTDPFRPRMPIKSSGSLDQNGNQRMCRCGCGASVRRRFLPGHDAKLKSHLLRRAREGDQEATDELLALGWD
jgi:predicted nuclease with RNAse H fold